MIDDLFLRQFIYGTWHSLFASEVIIKRRHNMVILSGLVTRTIHPRRMYFLIGYTEEILSALFRKLSAIWDCLAPLSAIQIKI